jgi:DNA-binding NarL/FixJ family response regulator
VKTIRLVIADDHTLVRAGICALMRNFSGVEIVAEADDGLAALRLIKAHKPDVAMVDIGMPKLNGIDLAARVSRECPEVRVLILSMHATEEYVTQALQAGAAGYLIKGADTAELEFALRSVVSEGTYLSPAVTRYVIGDNAGGSRHRTDSIARLTLRQREILQLLAEGHSTREIAFQLRISPKTVESHRSEIMSRLGLNDLASLIRYAIRMGLTTVE